MGRLWWVGRNGWAVHVEGVGGKKRIGEGLFFNKLLVCISSHNPIINEYTVPVLFPLKT